MPMYLKDIKVYCGLNKWSPNEFHKKWVKIGSQIHYFKSKWECNYARYLQFLLDNGSISGWNYEPREFWFDKIKRGCVSYKPDFLIMNLDSSHEWIEVKGYMDQKSKTKIKRFRKYYSDEKLSVVDLKWFKTNNKKLRGLIKDWE